MRITVRLIGAFTTGRFKESAIELPAATAVEDILRQLDLPAEIVGVILVNGHHATRDYQPVDGDIVTLLPLLAGG